MVDAPMPSITRRNLLSVAAASITATNARPTSGTPHDLQEVSGNDPVVPLWEEWFALHQHCGELCRRQQGLETRLFDIVRNMPKDEQDKAWDAVDDEVGYSRARQIEAEAMEAEQALVKALWKTPARSLVGIIAKLHSVVETEDPGDSLNITPWPELRSILNDLVLLNESGHKT